MCIWLGYIWFYVVVGFVGGCFGGLRSYTCLVLLMLYDWLLCWFGGVVLHIIGVLLFLCVGVGVYFGVVVFVLFVPGVVDEYCWVWFCCYW